jgi:predicted AAA+ superfamily ATPase
LAEILNTKTPITKNHEDYLDIHYNPGKQANSALNDLYAFGGFPEPFLSADSIEADRWRLSYSNLIIHTEMRQLEKFNDMDRIELLYDRLPDCVGSVLSTNSLREDLEVSFTTLKKWIIALERLYAVFKISPFGPVKIKAVKKEPKLYFWDWGRVQKDGAKWENMIAVHLLRFCNWMEDVYGQKYELRYFRTTVGHEVDFIIMKDKKPIAAIEAKVSDEPLDTNLKYLLERVKIPYAFQLSLTGKHDFMAPTINGSKIRIMPGAKFLANLV